MRVKVKPFFRWYDLRMGVYIDIDNVRGHSIYIYPLPTIGVRVWFPHPNLFKVAVRGADDNIEYITPEEAGRRRQREIDRYVLSSDGPYNVFELRTTPSDDPTAERGA